MANKAFHKNEKRVVLFRPLGANRAKIQNDAGEWIPIAIELLLLAEQIWPPLKRLWEMIKAMFTNNKAKKEEVRMHAIAAKKLGLP